MIDFTFLLLVIFGVLAASQNKPEFAALLFIVALVTNKDKVVLFVGILVGIAVIGAKLLFDNLPDWLLGGAVLLVLLTLLSRDPAHGGPNPEPESYAPR